MKSKKIVLLLASLLLIGCDNKLEKQPDIVDDTKNTENNEDNNSTECVHQYQLEKIDDEKHHERCTKCGEIKPNSTVAHTFTKDETSTANVAPTCTQEGNEHQICSCGAIKEQTLSKVSHTFVKYDEVLPSYSYDGYKAHSSY